MNHFFSARSGVSPWTLDWIGNPQGFNPTSGTRLVNAYLSERKNGALTDIAEQLCVTLSFEDLAELASNGRARFPLFTHGTHYELDIDPSRTSVCALLGLSNGHGSSVELIADWPYRLGSTALAEAADSRLVAVSDPLQIDPLFCVIPCMEVVRHFFCTSRHLAQHLLTGWDQLLVLDGCDAPRATKSVAIEARPGLGTTFEDAVTLGQYVASGNWRNIVDSIRRQLQRASVLGTTVAPVCPIPLREECSLGVEAIAVPTTTALGKRFFVTRIVTAPRPFDLHTISVQFGPGERRAQDNVVHNKQPWRDHSPSAHTPPVLIAARS